MHPTEHAIVEIGSHTVQLAVYSLDPDSGFHLMCEYDAKNRLRLIESLDARRELPGYVIHALIDTVRQFKRYCQSARVNLDHPDRIDIVATSAIREAANRSDIIAAVAAETGLTLRVLSEPEEAGLAADAVIHRTGLTNGIVIDLGGGALRLARVAQGKTVATETLALGALRLRQRFELRSDAQYEALSQMISQRLGSIPAALGQKNADPRIVAIGGVVRALGRMELARLDDQAEDGAPVRIGQPALAAWVLRLRTLTPLEIRALPGVPASRVDTVQIGATVITELLSAFRASALEIADVSIRDGLALRHARNRINLRTSEVYAISPLN
jgi:exopolyphosphatase / guanosine-5'-triphosphate,3'-diphosphate pyrophosphatase